MAKLEIRTLTVCYGEHTVLREVSFKVSGTGLTAIIGPSGAGKSTLLQAATRTLVYDRDLAFARRYGMAHVTGDIIKDGQSIEREPAHLYRRRVGYCLQEPVMLPGSVGYNLMEPLRIVRPHFTRKQRRHQAEAVLARVGLEEIPLSRRPGKISGGQRQRVTIARALILEPELIFLDEPTAALDPIAKRQILDLVRDLAESVPIIIVTHDMDIARHCDRVILLAEQSQAPGQGAGVICDGTPEDLLGGAMPRELSRMISAFADA